MPKEKREPFNALLKSYPDSEKINAVSEGAETLFTRLLAQADDADHYYGEPAMVLGKLYTRRMCAGQVDLVMVRARMDELMNARLIDTYDADGRQYIEIVNRRKELRADVKQDLRFPERVGQCTSRLRPEHGPKPGRKRDANRTETNPTETKQPLSAVADAVVPGKAELPPGFVRFWKAWPKHFRKQGRGECVRFWKKNKLEPIADRVIAAMEQSKASYDWTKEAGNYIPFPMTWLGRDPWETDPADLISDVPQSETDFSDPTDEQVAIYRSEV